MLKSLWLVRLGVCFLTYFLPVTTFAAESQKAEPGVSVIVHAGQTAFSGDLSKHAVGTTWGMNVIINQTGESNFENSAVGGVAGFWLFDFAGTSATAKKDTEFPFVPEKSLSIFESSIVPTVCVMAKLLVQACLGAGWTQLEVRGDDHKQTYGAFRSDVRVGHYLGHGLIGGLEAHYYGVDQEVSGKKSGFSGLAYQAGIGWQW